MTTLDRAAAVRPVESELADLICSDTDLLHAEFDAIIAAEWGGDHPPGRPTPPPPPPQRPVPPSPPEPAVRRPRRPPTVGRERPPGWQRAPPTSP